MFPLFKQSDQGNELTQGSLSTLWLLRRDKQLTLEWFANTVHVCKWGLIIINARYLRCFYSGRKPMRETYVWAQAGFLPIKDRTKKVQHVSHVSSDMRRQHSLSDYWVICLLAWLPLRELLNERPMHIVHTKAIFLSLNLININWWS